MLYGSQRMRGEFMSKQSSAGEKSAASEEGPLGLGRWANRLLTWGRKRCDREEATGGKFTVFAACES